MINYTLLLTFIILPIETRLFALIETSSKLSVWGGMAFFVDVSLAVILFILYSAYHSRTARYLVVSANFILGVLYVTNMEHVIALNTTFSIENITYLSSNVFVKGSFLTTRTALLLVAVAFQNLCIIWFGGSCKIYYRRFFPYQIAIAGILVSSVSIFFHTIELPFWR